jgi:aspartate/methionine/tyrosine aminotransferase
VEQSRRLVLSNLALLEDFLARRSSLFQWVRPNAGPIGFARVSGVEDVHGWCERIAAETGVLLLPGDVYGQPDHVRLGFGRAECAQALERLDAYLG